MPVVSKTLHGVIDYLAGIALLALPSLVGLPPGPGVAMLQMVGGATLALSLLTDYKPALARLVPYPIHLMLDVALGLSTLVASWLLAADPAEMLLLGAGVIYIAVPALSWSMKTG